jgi:putative Ca2+/H+ antiporter (TMEM165/GDT1 family)
VYVDTGPGGVVDVATFLEVVIAAATLQALVIPGEKVQMIIAGLATKYRPLPVVAGAALALGGWTALEVAFGEALQGTLPTIYLDAVTAGLFVLFALLLVRAGLGVGGEGGSGGGVGESDGEETLTDGGTETYADGRLAGLDAHLPDGAEGFFPAFSASAFGEFGDKTQLVTIGLAAQYGAHPGIWIGEMLVIVPMSAFTAFVFNRGARRLTDSHRRWLFYGSALLFLAFAADIAAAYWFGIDVLPV